jgi:hypothetical protein
VLNWLEELSESTTTIEFLLGLAENDTGHMILLWCDRKKAFKNFLDLKFFS